MGGKDPLFPKVPLPPKATAQPSPPIEALEPLSPFTEESTALHSTEDLESMLRKVEAAVAEPARQHAPSPFADDDHTMIGSAQELESLAKKAAPEPELPKSSANTVRRRTNPMGVAHVTGQMPAVRASGSIQIPAAPSPPPSRAPAPATQSDDDLFEAAFADSSFDADKRPVEPAPETAPLRSHEPTPAPPFKAAPPRAHEPTPAPPFETPPPSRARPTMPPMPPMPPMDVEDAQRAFETGLARPTAPASRGVLATISAVAVLLLITLIVGGVRMYNQISAAEDRTQDSDREVIRARTEAADVALQLATAKAKIEALKSSNAALERKLATQARTEAERIPSVERKR